MKRYIVGVDLGGTKISCGISDLEGNILEKATTPTRAEDGENAVLSRIIGSIEMLLSKSGVKTEEVEAIGIGSPGPLDAKRGIIIESSNLPFKNFNLTAPIAQKFNVPVYLDNDANVAAIGEFMFGAGKGTENMVYITVSTGVGGGAVLNRKIYRGNTSNALEIGHTTVLPGGPRCNCGNIGCLEALASGTAIAKRGKEAALSNVNTTLKKYENITSFEVFEEAKAKDEVAGEIIEEAMTYLGIGVANFISTFDPEIVIIGGGVSKAGSIVLETVQRVVNKRCLKSMAESCSIVPAALGNDAGVIGAAALGIMENRSL